jgi:hypothetical protein
MFASHSSRSRPARCLALAAATCGAALALAVPAGAAENFVVGDQSAAVGAHVTFWGAQWWKLNSLSGGPAPAAFKGFANEVQGSCGGSWTTDPGNSSDPPAAPLPPFIEALVSHSITKHGRVISGDIVSVVRIATDPGYGPSPGHAGTGTVLSVVCGPGAEEPEEEGPPV